MRVLFYLPVVTPWWFDTVVAPLIAVAARDADVSVLVPPLWSNTGIGPEQLEPLVDLGRVEWHILGDDNHPDLRTSAMGNTGLIELVRSIDADYTICRSADIATPALFPGRVRYLMEGQAQPLAIPHHWCQLTPTLFDHGIMPALTAEERTLLETAIDPAWRRLPPAAGPDDRAAFLSMASLPTDRPVIVLPLEYEHPEMFFGQHTPYGSNVDLIHSVAAAVGPDFTVAVTIHPLSYLHCDNDDVFDAIAAHGHVRLVGERDVSGNPTDELIRHADAMIVGNSKSIGIGAAYGVPMLRLSTFASGEWMRTSGDIATFTNALRTGTVHGAASADARRWFGYHVANNAFDPDDPALTLADIVDRMDNPCNPLRWNAGLARFTLADPDPVDCPPSVQEVCHV